MYQDPPIPLEITPILYNVQIWKGNDQYYVTYELKVVNGSNQPIYLDSLMANKSIYKNLTLRFSKLSSINQYQPERPLLHPNECGMIFIQKRINNKYIKNHIKSIQNVLNIKVNNQLQSIKCNKIYISLEPPIIIKPPLKGTNWYIVNGFNNDGSHRRATFILNGNIQLPERFAVDIIKYNKQGQLLKGDPKLNTSYFAYGQTVYAVADGVVVNRRNDMNDNIPGQPITNLTSQTINGNYLLIKHDSNHYMYYAHMIPGSVQYKIGQHVKEGDFIGLLGNSGASTIPHLHFHVSNRPHSIGNDKFPSAINAQGIPWAIDQFVKKSYQSEGHSTLVYDIPLKLSVDNTTIVKNQIVIQKNLVNFNM
jgi:murein DD-endopeptidase MepM/ murein hydrolase activator NlpD